MRTHASSLKPALFVLLTALLLAQLALAEPTPDPDAEGILAAVGDYVDGVYQVDPSRIERSVHPRLQKVGYYVPEESTEYREAWMNYYELVELAAGYNADGHVDAKTAPRVIRIVDRLDVTAVARLDAEWGVDYFELAKKDGRWTIMNVIWQTHAPEPFSRQPEAEAEADAAGIRQAVLDYANSAYLVAPELIAKSVHPHVQKVGYVHDRDGGGYRERWMNFTELEQLVAGWNTGHKRFDPATAKREIQVLDRLDQIALARLDAEWGVDYFHLAKKDGRWIIMNVVWQAYPKSSGE